MIARTKKRHRQKCARSKGETIGRLINAVTSSRNGLEAGLLKELREICMVLPEARETVKWGHPTFEAGKKIFAVLDHYHGHPCIAFRSSRKPAMELLRDERFFPAPYAAAQGWVCLRADGELEWSEVRDLLMASYRIVALKRMLSALDAGAKVNRRAALVNRPSRKAISYQKKGH